MNLQAIAISNGIGIFLTLVVLKSSYMARKSRGVESRLMTLLLLIAGSSCAMEMVSFLVDGNPGLFCRVMNLLSNTWIYISNPLLSLTWLLYTDYHLYRKEKRLTTVYRPYLILTAALGLAVLGNIPGRYLFSIDAQNIYSRRPWSYSMYAFTLFMLGRSVLEVRRYRRRYKILPFFPMWIFLTPIVVGIVLQSLIYGVSLAWCCTVLGLAALHMSMQNELAYVDSLTGLYNRLYLDRALSAWIGRSGIMIDMDYFKEINDRYGHSTGDEALRETAKLLREAAPEDSLATRFAGDEFILLLNTSQEEDLLRTEKQIRESVDRFNQTSGKPYTISLSMGHANFEAKDRDAFLEAIDRAMYLEKRRKHAQGELRERRSRS